MKIYRLLLLAAGLTAAAVLAQPQQAPKLEAPGSGQPKPAGSVSATVVSPDTVVLTVGAEKFTRAQFEQILAALAENGQAATSAAAKRSVAEELSQVVALAQEARKRKLDQTNAAKQMMMIQGDTVLARALQRQVSADVAPDDTALHAYYDAHKAQFEQVKARHILIRFKSSPVPARPNQKELTEEEALAKAHEVEKKLQAGEDFAAVAKTESDDTGTAGAGGALPPFSKGQMVPEFEQAVFSQSVGKISEPVKTKYGYHIIKVDERISKTFEQAKPEIEKQLRPQLIREAMERLTKQVGIVMDDGYFGK